MILDVWHGTNQEFTRFDPAHRGLSTSNEAARAAFFFAARPDTAWDYADLAAKHLVPQQEAHEAKVRDLIAQAGRAERRRDWEAYERLTAAYERLEADALQAEPRGSRVLRCRIRLENPLELDGGSQAVLANLDGAMAAARAAGHDGVILRGIHDTPSGVPDRDDHFAVFDADRIEILEVLLERPPEPAPEPEEEMPAFA